MKALGYGEITELALARFARSSAASFLVESTDQHGGEAEFRLFHQALRDALLRTRAGLTARDVDEQALTRAFMAAGQEMGWDQRPRVPAAFATSSRCPDRVDRQAARRPRLPPARRPAPAAAAGRPGRHPSGTAERAAAPPVPARRDQSRRPGPGCHVQHHRSPGSPGGHLPALQRQCPVPRRMGGHPAKLRALGPARAQRPRQCRLRAHPGRHRPAGDRQ